MVSYFVSDVEKAKRNIANKVINGIKEGAFKWEKRLSLRGHHEALVCDFESDNEKILIFVHHSYHRILSHWRQMHLTIGHETYGCELSLNDKDKKILFNLFTGEEYESDDFTKKYHNFLFKLEKSL